MCAKYWWAHKICNNRSSSMIYVQGAAYLVPLKSGQANKLSRTSVMLLEALNRHRGKGEQKVTVEHVHVHAGGQAVVGMIETPGGGDRPEIRGSTPCKANCPCASADAAERRRGTRAGANRPRCRTAGVGCTAAYLREHRGEIGTHSSMGATQQQRSPGAEKFPDWCA